MRRDDTSGGRAVVYCVVPRELAEKLHETLRRHFQDEPGVEVIVERRLGERERRAAADRRRSAAAAPKVERRKVRNPRGRRLAERRATVLEVRAPELPRRARAHAARLTFMERLEPATERAEDLDTARLVASVQAGDQEAFGLIYLRYFDRVYNYVRVILNSRSEAEDAAQQIFIDVLQSLPGYEDYGGSFRAWLFTVARNHSLNELRKLHRLETVDPGEMDQRREVSRAAAVGAATAEPDPFRPLEWISDGELYLFLERLPLVQRQVLVLRYMLDLGAAEIGEVLGLKPEAVRQQQSRALGFLRRRLVALGRAPRGRGDRIRSRLLIPQDYVIRARRFSLVSSGPVR